MNRFTINSSPADRLPDVASERRRARVVLLTAAVLGCVAAAAEVQAAGTTTRVSVDSAGNQSGPGGKQGQGLSDQPALSADARFVAFRSFAENLVPGDTNFWGDVFVHDRRTGRTSRVNVDSVRNQGTGLSGEPAISADGRTVAFLSESPNLVPGDTNGTDIFVHDRKTQRTTRVSVDSAGNQGNAVSLSPALSADGRYVAFDSYADNLVPGDTNGVSDVFVHDRKTRRTTRISVDSAGIQGDAYSNWPALSADGRYVAFTSYASNLVRGRRIYHSAVYVHDRKRHRTACVSVDSEGVAGDRPAARPVISADGRYVAFSALVSDPEAGDTWSDILVHDRTTHQTARVNGDSTGAQTHDDQATFPPSIAMSADGRFIVFSSGAPNLVAGDTNGQIDVFLHDRATHQTTRVSVNSDGEQMEGSTNQTGGRVAISADGRVAVFSSDAANLVPQDTNRISDVFVHDRLFDAGGSADLSLAASSRTDAASAPDRRRFDLVAANQGPDSAAEAALTIRLATNTGVIEAASSSEGGCSQGPVLIVCRLGALSVGGSAAVSLTLESKPAGDASLGSAEVNAAPQDPSPRNNRTPLKDATHLSRSPRSGVAAH